MLLTPCSTARRKRLIGWSREDLAKSSGVGANTAKDFEINGSDPKLGTVQKWRRALEAAGVIFIDPGTKPDEGEAGVRLRGTKGKR
jgi:transcriptional regulator with XRE-family HTH domain